MFENFQLEIVNQILVQLEMSDDSKLLSVSVRPAINAAGLCYVNSLSAANIFYC